MDDTRSVTYRYLHYGIRQDYLCNSVDNALSLALDDLRQEYSIPFEIIQDGRVVFAREQIQAFYLTQTSEDRQPFNRAAVPN